MERHAHHPVHRVPRVFEEKQQRRAHLQVVPDDDIAESPGESVSVNGSRHAVGPQTAEKSAGQRAAEIAGEEPDDPVDSVSDPVDSMLEELRESSTSDFEALWPEDDE